MSDALLCFAAVGAAAERILRTRRQDAVSFPELLSRPTGTELWLKYKKLQFTGSLKQRGALKMLLSLSPEERDRGIIAVSAGIIGRADQ